MADAEQLGQDGAQGAVRRREALDSQVSGSAYVWWPVQYGMSVPSGPISMLIGDIQRPIAGNRYVKNYEFDFSFGPPWGHCSVTMTSVIGHIHTLDFEQQYRKWNSCPPGQLFDAPTISYVVAVCLLYLLLRPCG